MILKRNAPSSASIAGACLAMTKGWRAALAIAVLLASHGLALGASANFVYDATGRLVQVIGTGGSSARYSYDAAGNLLSVTPLTATTPALTGFSVVTGAVGNTIEIYGSGFDTTAGNNTVEFNGVAATVSSATANRLVVVIPSGATTGTVTISNGNGTSSSTLPFTVAVPPNAPTITSFTPSMGMPGATVTIAGSNFHNAPNTTVTFGALPAVVSSASSSSITVVVPPNASSGRISVHTTVGATNSANDFIVPEYTGWQTNPPVTGRLTVNGSPLTLTLPPATTHGLALFEGVAGDIVRVNVTNNGFATSCSANLLELRMPGRAGMNAFNRRLGNSNFCTGSSAPFFLPVSGTYTLSLVPSSTAGGALEFTVNRVAVTSTQIEIDGDPVSVTSTTAGQAFQLRFSSTVAAQHVVITPSSRTYTPSCSQQKVYVTGPMPGDGLNEARVTPYLAESDLCGSVPVKLNGIGSYVITVVPNGVDSGGVTLALDALAPVTDDIEVDGSPVTVTTTTNGQVAQLTFETTTANETVVVEVTSTTFPGGRWDLYGMVTGPSPSSALIKRVGLVAPTAITLSEPGTYVLTMGGPADESGSITVALTSAAPVTETVTIDGSPVTVETTIVGQRAHISLTSTTPNQTVSVINTNGSFDGQLHLYGPPPANQWLGYTPIWWAWDKADLFVLPTVGTYTLVLIPDSNYPGSVDFQVMNAAPVTGSVSIDGSPTTLTTTVAGQRAQLTFSTTTADQLVSIQVNDVTLDSGLYIRGPSPSSDTVFTSNWVPCCGSSSDTAYLGEFDSPGTYTMEFVPDDITPGSVTTQLQNAPTVTGTISINGSAVTKVTTVPAQRTELTFTTTTANQAVTLTPSGVTYPTSTEQTKIVGPNGAVYQSRNLNGTSASSTLGAAGTYTIVVSGRSYGSVTLQLTSP